MKQEGQCRIISDYPRNFMISETMLYLNVTIQNKSKTKIIVILNNIFLIWLVRLM